MGKQKSEDKKKKKKNSQLVIRIDTAERDAFVKLCDSLDTSAAREIRRFMREWVTTHSSDEVSMKAGQAAEGSPEPLAAPEAKTAPKRAPARRKPTPAKAPDAVAPHVKRPAPRRTPKPATPSAT